MRARPGPPPAPPWYTRAYARAIRPVLRRPWIGLAAAHRAAGGGAVATRFVGTGFLPSMDEGAFVLDYFLPAGTSLTDTDAAARKIEAILQAIPEVQTYSRRTGAELGPVAATEVSRGDIMVRLKAASARHRSADDVISDARARIEHEVPEARVEFVQVLQDVLNDLSGTPRPIEVKLYGDDYAALRAQATATAARIQDVPGLVDLYKGFEGDAPELSFRVDPGAGGAAGNDRRRRQRRSRRGLARRGRVDRFAAPTARSACASAIPTPSASTGSRCRACPLLAPGGVTAIGAVADAEQIAAPSTLVRENLRPVAILTADHEDRDLGSVAVRRQSPPRGDLAARRLRARARRPVPRPARHLPRARGRARRSACSPSSPCCSRSFAARASRWSCSASVPLAVVGALLDAARDRRRPERVVADGLRDAGRPGREERHPVAGAGRVASGDRGAPLDVALVEAGTIRVRPILMTTLATVAGLAPLALGLGAGADLQRPLALAVMGGLLFSTAVSLFVTPALVGLAFRHRAAAAAPTARSGG